MAQTERRMSPPLEEDWPGERDPGRRDAEIANSPVETSFIQAFRQALLAGREKLSPINFFDEDAELSWQAHGQAVDDEELSYPLILFSGVEYPPEDEVAEMLRNFWLFQSSASFLSCVPRGTFKATGTPPYLLFSIACIGLIFAPTCVGQEYPESHWWTATALIHGMMEVDNREARRISLVIAWILLLTYGVLHADPSIWHRTNITQGYVETATRRIFANISGSDSGHRTVAIEGVSLEDQGSSIMSYFLLIDLLRAIHYGLPANFAVAELYVPLSSTNHDLSTLYKSVIDDSSHLPRDLSSNHILLLLVALLADVNTLGATFLPLTETLGDHRTVGDGSGSINISKEDWRQLLRNPYLPCSPQSEVSQASGRLSRFLDVVNEVYIKTLDNSIVSFYYFCRMFLAFPHLQALAVLSGYAPRTYFNTIPEALLRRRVADGVLHGEEALQHAWLILESLDDVQDLEAVWLPIIVFYSGLVVWGMITFGGQSGSRGSLKVLSLFSAKLDAMRWPCCRAMALHLQVLMTRARDSKLV